MNLYFRFFWVVIASWFKPKITNVLTAQKLRMRVLPNDLDFNMHMNNSRYQTVMDLGRVDFIFRTGLYQEMKKIKAMPVLSTAKMRYRIPLAPFQQYDLETRMVCWDDKWLYIEHRFIIAKGERAGVIAAIGLVKGAFYSRETKETVPTQKLLEITKLEQESPKFPEYILQWSQSDNALRDHVRETSASKPPDMGAAA